ncbi:MAG: 2-oxoacid:ferredoxin oxidoreductase subunit beta, partial [Myxococcota bacterium]|nr:2-oxoacid:ferredoxin oxidoreductase subunit beta [Myxococcota bacterium]
QGKAQLIPVLHRASAHRGTSLVEVFQNCWVYNDQTFAGFTDKAVASDRQIFVEHGQPLVFGKEKDKGIRLQPGTMQPEVVNLNDDGVSIDDVLVHDETDRVLAGMLAAMIPPDLPVAVGVLLCEPADISFHEAVHAQMEQAKNSKGPADLDAMFRQGYTWEL